MYICPPGLQRNGESVAKAGADHNTLQCPHPTPLTGVAPLETGPLCQFKSRYQWFTSMW